MNKSVELVPVLIILFSMGLGTLHDTEQRTPFHTFHWLTLTIHIVFYATSEATCQ